MIQAEIDLIEFQKKFNKVTIGRNVLRIRTEILNMSLAQFADKAHISRQNINRIEKGECCMNAETLGRLCYFHNIAPDIVLYGISHEDIRRDKDNKREIADCLDKAKRLLHLEEDEDSKT